MPTNHKHQLNEGQSGWFDISFYDTDGVTPAVPVSSVTYTIHDLLSGTVVNAGGSIGAAATVTVPIVPAETAILDDTRRFEAKRLTYVAPFGATDAYVGFIDFHVQNLKYRP